MTPRPMMVPQGTQPQRLERVYWQRGGGFGPTPAAPLAGNVGGQLRRYALPGYAEPGPYNVYIPTAGGDTYANGALVISYSRNKDQFALPRYTTLTKVKSMTGFYKDIDPKIAIRIRASDASENIWQDGQPRPQVWPANQSLFRNLPFITKRWFNQKEQGYLSREQQDTDFQSIFSAELGTWGMTNRSKQVANLLANFSYTAFGSAGENTGTGTQTGGGAFYASSLDNAYIQKGLTYAAMKINLNTAGGVHYNDLCLVMNPNTARKIAASPEVKNALITQNGPRGGSPDLIQGMTNLNEAYMLLPYLFGMKCIIEDSPINTDTPTAQTDNAFILADDAIYIVARPGGITGIEGAVSFSTIHVLSYQEMEVETYDDVYNKRYITSIVDNFDVQMVAPAALYRISSCNA